MAHFHHWTLQGLIYYFSIPIPRLHHSNIFKAYPFICMCPSVAFRGAFVYTHFMLYTWHWDQDSSHSVSDLFWRSSHVAVYNSITCLLIAKRQSRVHFHCSFLISATPPSSLPEVVFPTFSYRQRHDEQPWKCSLCDCVRTSLRHMSRRESSQCFFRYYHTWSSNNGDRYQCFQWWRNWSLAGLHRLLKVTQQS